MTQKDRYNRQKDIVPADRLKDMTITVIGVGAIGRQVALQLTAIGVNHLVLIDPDVVEITNLSSQGYEQGDLGKAKVLSTCEDCKDINTKIQIDLLQGEFTSQFPLVSDIIFCCVDSIETRQDIWDSLKEKCKTSTFTLSFFCDGRMSAEALRVITVYDEPSKKHYPETLFAGKKAYKGKCTAKSTFYTANIAAGLMVAQFVKFLRNIPADYDFSFNILTNEINVMAIN